MTMTRAEAIDLLRQHIGWLERRNCGTTRLRAAISVLGPSESLVKSLEAVESAIRAAVGWCDGCDWDKCNCAIAAGAAAAVLESSESQSAAHPSPDFAEIATKIANDISCPDMALDHEIEWIRAALAEAEKRGRRKGLEEAAEACATRAEEAGEGCKHYGKTSAKIGELDCWLDQECGRCDCAAKIEFGLDIAASIRALIPASAPPPTLPARRSPRWIVRELDRVGRAAAALALETRENVP